MGDSKHHHRTSSRTTPKPGSPPLKPHGDPLSDSLASDWRPGFDPVDSASDPTAQPDGDDGNPESGARGARELRKTREAGKAPEPGSS